MASTPLFDSDACADGCACACHDSPISRIAPLGIDWRRLSRTEIRLLAALTPAGTVRTYEWLIQTLRPEWELDIRRAIRFCGINSSRLRVKIHPQGWTAGAINGVGLRLEPYHAPTPQPAKESPKPRQFSSLTRALAAGLCPASACHLVLDEHLRCARCDLLVGPQHTNTSVNAEGLCSWCAQVRQAAGRIASGLRQGDHVRAQVQA